MITTQAVQLEVMNAMSPVLLRGLAVQFWQASNSDPDLTVVPLDGDLLRRGADLYERRPDKGWSLTDCISFIVMQDRGITTALTGDHHFEQAGFQIAFK
jgi:predicted nucleic acid-binding protein